MIPIGKRARRETGMNRNELKRANHQKRHDNLNDPNYDPKKSSNARHAAKRDSERK